MKGFETKFAKLVRDQLLEVVEQLRVEPENEELWDDGQKLLAKIMTPPSEIKKRPRPTADLESDPEEEEEPSESMSLQEEEDDDLEVELDDGGRAAYRILKSVRDWDAYLRTPYARRTFGDALNTVLGTREHGTIRACFDAMLQCIDDIVIDGNRPSVRGTCQLCKRKRNLTYKLTCAKGTWIMGANCGKLMEKIYRLMRGIWKGDATEAIQEKLDAVVEANKAWSE
jgi:hypothetical protein